MKRKSAQGRSRERPAQEGPAPPQRFLQGLPEAPTTPRPPFRQDQRPFGFLLCDCGQPLGYFGPQPLPIRTSEAGPGGASPPPTCKWPIPGSGVEGAPMGPKCHPGSEAPELGPVKKEGRGFSRTDPLYHPVPSGSAKARRPGRGGTQRGRVPSSLGGARGLIRAQASSQAPFPQTCCGL